MKLRVKDHPQYYRDNQSYGIVHDNDKEYAEYQNKKIAQKKVQEEKARLEARLNNLESEMSELKSGINEILSFIKHGTKDPGTKNG